MDANELTTKNSETVSMLVGRNGALGAVEIPRAIGNRRSDE